MIPVLKELKPGGKILITKDPPPIFPPSPEALQCKLAQILQYWLIRFPYDLQHTVTGSWWTLSRVGLCYSLLSPPRLELCFYKVAASTGDSLLASFVKQCCGLTSTLSLGL